MLISFHSFMYSTHELFQDCWNESRAKGNIAPESLAVLVRTVEEDPGMARQIFFSTFGEELGFQFILKYQNDPNFGRTAYQISQALNLGMKEEEFNIPAEIARPGILSFCFLEGDFGNAGCGSLHAHSQVVSNRESRNWSGSFDNAIRAYEDNNCGALF